MAQESKPKEKENKDPENNQELQENSQNQEQTKSSEEIQKEIAAEKEKELQLIKQRNQALEQELKGKSTYEPPEDPEEKITRECNKYLEGTGLQI